MPSDYIWSKLLVPSAAGTPCRPPRSLGFLIPLTVTLAVLNTAQSEWGCSHVTPLPQTSWWLAFSPSRSQNPVVGLLFLQPTRHILESELIAVGSTWNTLSETPTELLLSPLNLIEMLPPWRAISWPLYSDSQIPHIRTPFSLYRCHHLNR